jgi:hypothetical protein
MNVIQTAQRVSGKVSRVEMAPRRRPGDPEVPVGAADRARAVLGWKPKLSALDVQIIDAWNLDAKKRRRYGEWPANRCLNSKEGQAAHPLLLQSPCHAISILA